MSVSHRFSFTGFIVFLVSAIVWLPGCSVSSAPHTATLEETTALYQIQVAYPVFPSERDQVLNQAVAEARDGFVSSFKRDANELLTEGYEGSLITTYSVVYSSPSFVSVVLTVGEYTGGAHGFSYPITFNYDRTTQRVLSFSDVFTTQGLPLLSTQARERVEALDVNPDASWIEDGTAPIEDNFRAFVLTPDGVRVLFAPYQVAAYAAGIVSIDVPYSALQGGLQTPVLALVQS